MELYATLPVVYTVLMSRKRIYAIHYAPVIPGATMADYVRDYYIDDGKARRVMRWLFYRQDANGRSEVREYRDFPDSGGLIDALVAADIPLEIYPRSGAYRFEPFRPKFQRWYLGINPHTGRKE